MMECFTEYLQVSRYKIIQIDLIIPTYEDEAKEKRKSWFGEEHLQELLILLRDVIWERLKSVSVGDKQTRKKSREKNKSGTLTGKLITAEYKFKLKKIRQSCIIPSQGKPGGKYKGCCLEKEKLEVTVEQIHHHQSKEPVPSNSEHFRSEDKDDGDFSDRGEEDSRKKQLKNVISKSGKQISKKSKRGRQRKKEATAACDEESGDDEDCQGSLRQWITSWRTPKKKPRSRSPKQTDHSRSYKDCSRSKEGQSGSDEGAVSKGCLESRSSSVVSDESVYREYRSNEAADSKKVCTPPKKRKIRMADFILHPGTKQDDDDVEVDKVSNDGATGSELVKKKRRPDLNRFESKFKKGCKMKEVAQGDQYFSDEEESVSGACSDVDENGSGDEVDGCRESEQDVGVVGMDYDKSGGNYKSNQDFGMKDYNDANELQNSAIEHHKDIGAQDIVKSETSQDDNSLSNTQPHLSQVDRPLSGETILSIKKRPDSKHGKSLVSGASDGSFLRQRKKCTVMPVVKPQTVMTAIQQGKVVEITKKESKVCLSYVNNDNGERVRCAADEKRGSKAKGDLGENSNQEVVKFCQALKSKKKLLAGQCKSEDPPFIELDEEFWEKDLSTNDLGSVPQTSSMGKQLHNDTDESDSGDDLPNMEAIISQSSNSQNSNCSGVSEPGLVSPLNSPNASQSSDKLPSTSSDKSVSCTHQDNEARVDSESHKCYVGIGRKRKLVNSSKDSKSKKDSVSDSKQNKDVDSVSKKKRPKSKERVGIFEQLSPARAGGMLMNDCTDMRSQAVQTDAVQKKTVSEEKSYEIELEGLGGNDFKEAEMEENDVELKSLACAGPNGLGVGIGPMISPGISDQRSTGAKSVGGEGSGNDGDGEVIPKREGESLELEPTETCHNRGSASEKENQPSGLAVSLSRSKRFKGSYLEYDSDLAAKEKTGKTKSNRCDHDTNDYSDSSSALPEVSSPQRKGSKRLRKNLPKNASKSRGTEQVKDENDDQYYSSSSLHSKTDLGSDFPQIPVAPRKKTLSTSTCTSSTVLESYDFLAAKRSHLDEDSSSSHQDWETFSVQSNTEYTNILEHDNMEYENENPMMMDSGFNSSANTTIASLNHAGQPDNLPTIVPAKKKNQLKSSPWKVKLKTGKDTKGAQRKKRLTKKVKSPRSPRGLGKFLLTSSLQTFSSSKEREAVNDHEELPDLFPAFGGVPSRDNDIISGAEALCVSNSLSETHKTKRLKVTKSVCRKKNDESDTEFEVSKPSKEGASSKEKGTKCRRKKQDGSLGAKKSRTVCKKDKPSVAHLMSSSSEDESKSHRDLEEVSDGSVARNIGLGNLDREAQVSKDVLEASGAATGETATISDSDADSDKTLPAVPQKSDDESVWKDTKATSKAKSRRCRERRKHVLPSLADDDVESASDGEVPARGPRLRRSGSTSSVSSAELPSVSFVSEIRKRLSLCPVVDDDMVVIIEELSTPVMIKVEDEVADEIEREIKSIHDVSELSEGHLQFLVNKYEKYLREIFHGKSQSWRHEDYKRGGRDRQNLTYNIHTLRYREVQEDTVMQSLMKIFCSKHQKYLDYVFKVMFPEMLIKIYMEVHTCCMEKAEADLQDVVVDDIV